MTNQVPGVAVVGCGTWGKNLVRNFYEQGALRFIYDPDRDCASQILQQYPVRSASSFDDLLSEPSVHAIVISAPAVRHFELAKKVLLAGKDVFVEKPLALCSEDAQELIALAETHSRVLMVGHLLLFHPVVLRLQKMIHSGDLGKVQYVYSSRLNLGRLRTEENILWSFAPHDISVLLYLLRELPRSCSAHGSSYLNSDVNDITLSTFDFSSGVRGHIFVSWLHPFKEQKLVVVADRKIAVFDDTEPERKLVVYPHRIDWVERVPVARKAEGESIPVENAEPLRLECQHFLECIAERRIPRTDGRSALEVLKVLEACQQSLEHQGNPVQLETKSARSLIHPTAVVDEPAEIGERTRIWHFSHIMPHAKVGRNCVLGQNVHVASNVKIGNNVKIQNNVSLYTGVELEDDVFCGPSMVFTNVINPRSQIERKLEYQRTLVKQGASLGANSTIVCGVVIGEYAFVAAGAVVTRDVSPYALVMGVPARRVGWMCRCGVRLAESSEVFRCSACGELYSMQEGKLRTVIPASEK